MTPQALNPPNVEIQPPATAESGTPQTEAAAAEPPAPTEPEAAPATVPLARLQGVQRQLSVVERDRDGWKAQAQVLQDQLSAANQTAANSRIAEIRATHHDIVPSLIMGSTIDQVETSLQQSRAAFAAAQQAYARQIPTAPPAGNPPAQPAADQPSLSPLQMLSAGLRQPKTDINR